LPSAVEPVPEVGDTETERQEDDPERSARESDDNPGEDEEAAEAHYDEPEER
jgi:hypothetical protein